METVLGPLMESTEANWMEVFLVVEAVGREAATDSAGAATLPRSKFRGFPYKEENSVKAQ
jgi:hypothetical protein